MSTSDDDTTATATTATNNNNKSGPATSPSYSDGGVHPRSPTSKDYKHRRHAMEGEGSEDDGSDEDEDHRMDAEIEKQTMQINQLEKWGKRQGFRKTESPPPTPRREIFTTNNTLAIGNNLNQEEDADEYSSYGGVAGARERGERDGVVFGRKRTGIKLGSGRGSPNAPDGRSDNEEYHPMGSNFVVPSTNDDEEVSSFRRIPTKQKSDRNSNSSSHGNNSSRNRNSRSGRSGSGSSGSGSSHSSN